MGLTRRDGRGGSGRVARRRLDGAARDAEACRGDTTREGENGEAVLSRGRC